MMVVRVEEFVAARALALEQLGRIEERALELERTLLEYHKVAARHRDGDGGAAGGVVLGRKLESAGPQRIERVPMARWAHEQAHELLHRARSHGLPVLLLKTEAS